MHSQPNRTWEVIAWIIFIAYDLIFDYFILVSFMLLLDKMVRSCKVLRCLVLKNCYFFPVKLQPSRRRSLFTLATSMIIFASKAYNILSLISIAKTTLTDRTVCISCSIQSFSFKLFYFPYFPHFLLLLANALIIYSTVLSISYWYLLW